MIEKTITLRCTEGNSNKVYIMRLVKNRGIKEPSNWKVESLYGPANAVNRQAGYPDTHTDYFKAERIFQKKLKEKLRKNYRIV